MQQIWDIIKNQILGMKWLNELLGKLLNACGLDSAGADWRQYSVLYFRHDKNIRAARVSDFYHIVHTELFSARKNEKDTRRISWRRRKYPRCAARNSHTLLFLLINSVIYRIYKCRTAARGDIFISYFLSDG